jgi:hypothetical protein
LRETINSATLSIPHHSRNSDIKSLKKKWKSATTSITSQLGSSLDGILIEVILGNDLNEPMVALGLQEGASFLLPHIKGDHTQ